VLLTPKLNQTEFLLAPDTSSELPLLGLFHMLSLYSSDHRNFSVKSHSPHFCVAKVNYIIANMSFPYEDIGPGSWKSRTLELENIKTLIYDPVWPQISMLDTSRTLSLEGALVMP